MNKTLLAAVSLAAVTASGIAFAESRVHTQAQSAIHADDINTGSNHSGDLATVPQVTSENIRQGMDSAGQAISETANEISSSIEKSYQEIKAALINDANETQEIDYVVIKENHTVKNIIGSTVRNERGDAVAKVEDIILNADGEAVMVVVTNGGILGLGAKRAAFSYDAVMRLDDRGDVIMPLTAEAISSAAAFSYDARTGADNIRVIPTGGLSAKNMLSAKVVDNKGKALGNVHNIVMEDGDAEYIVMSFGDVMGMGGQRAVIEFDDLRLNRTDSGVEFQMSAAQSASFESFKAMELKSN